MTINPPPQPEGHLTWDDVKAMHAELGRMRAELADLGGLLKGAARQADMNKAADVQRNQQAQRK